MIDKCPICSKPFKWCPHNIAQANDAIEKKRIQAIVDKAVKKALKRELKNASSNAGNCEDRRQGLSVQAKQDNQMDDGSAKK